MPKLLKFFVTGLAASFLSSAVWAAPQAKIQTSMGDIVVELNAEKAPASVENFIRYAKDKFYDGTIFHRVINSFMIQGGGFDEKMNEKTTQYPPIKNEAANGLKNDRGTIAMARTQEPHSASAQFYINVADNAPLNHRSPDINGYGYAVFGKVVSGMDVVDKIKEVQTGNKGPYQNVPVKPVIIKSITIIGEVTAKEAIAPEKAAAPAKPAQ